MLAGIEHRHQSRPAALWANILSSGLCTGPSDLRGVTLPMPKDSYRSPKIVDYGPVASLTLGSGGKKDDNHVTKDKK